MSRLLELVEGEDAVLVLVKQHEHLLQVRHQLRGQLPELLLRWDRDVTKTTSPLPAHQVDVDDEVVLLPHHALLALHLPHPHAVHPGPRGLPSRPALQTALKHGYFSHNF